MVLQDWQVRVVNEQEELEHKINKLKDYLETDSFNALPEEDKNLLRQQRAAMQTYSCILGWRIQRFTQEKKDDLQS